LAFWQLEEVMFRSKFTGHLACAGAIVLLAGAGSLVLRAFNPQPDPPGVYSMIGINPSETLAFHVVNVGGSNGYPPGPCKVTLGLINSEGKMVKSSNAVLAAGAATTLKITFSEGANAAELSTMRAAYRPVFTADTVNGCAAVSSAEVFQSSTGQGQLYALPAVQHLTVATTTAPSAQ
jgi:hypothetical protein